MNYYLFIDESGDHGLTNIDHNFPVFVLCAVLISHESYEKLISEIQSIKQHFWKSKKVIFHSRDIRKCDKEFQIFFDSELKKEFYSKVNDMIQNNDYFLIASAINKDKYIKKYGRLAQNVYEISLSFAIERSIFALDDLNESNEKLKIIIEKRGKVEDNELKDYFNKIIQRGTGYIDKHRLKNHNLDIEFKTKTDYIDGLQLADLLAYPIARYTIDEERANPAFDILKNKFYTKNGKNLGLKIFP